MYLPSLHIMFYLPQETYVCISIIYNPCAKRHVPRGLKDHSWYQWLSISIRNRKMSYSQPTSVEWRVFASTPPAGVNARRCLYDCRVVTPRRLVVVWTELSTKLIESIWCTRISPSLVNLRQCEWIMFQEQNSNYTAVHRIWEFEGPRLRATGHVTYKPATPDWISH